MIHPPFFSFAEGSYLAKGSLERIAEGVTRFFPCGLTIVSILVTWLCVSFTSAYGDNKPQPLNIVLILVDDAALMDFGVYGGEASTPNIDTLARQGAMFTQYRTSPLCSPTRAMLVSGLDNHLTGMANRWELPEEQAQALHDNLSKYYFDADFPLEAKYRSAWVRADPVPKNPDRARELAGSTLIV